MNEITFGGTNNFEYKIFMSTHSQELANCKIINYYVRLV